MKKALFFSIIIMLFFSCSPGSKISKPAHSDNIIESNQENDGSSYEKAIIINENTETKGVDAEYLWIRQHYPGYKSNGQSLNYHEKKPYDIIKITTSEGKNKSIYFDISRFYGKF